MKKDQTGTRVVIGLTALAFAAVITWFSAWPTLVCSRDAVTGVTCAVGAKIVNTLSVHDARVAGVRSVTLVRSAVRDSDTPPRLIFVTDRGREDLGYFSQRFVPEAAAIDAFVRESDARTLRLAKPIGVQAVSAIAAIIVLVALGILTLRSAFRR